MDDKDLPAAQPAPAEANDSVQAPADSERMPDAISLDVDAIVQPDPQWVALLDEAGVLIGYDETGIAEGVRVPVDCDLVPGKYRWDGKAFHPLLDRFGAGQIVKPEDRTAIALALIALRDGKPLPAYTLAWLKAFESTVDAQG